MYIYIYIYTYGCCAGVFEVSDDEWKQLKAKVLLYINNLNANANNTSN